MITKAISVRAPWWWLVVHGGKTHENRDWPTNFRGRVYIHASKWWKPEEVYEDFQDVKKFTDNLSHSWPSVTLGEMKSAGGCIVGSVEIVDCVTSSDSPWFMGKYGFVLANPIPLVTPVPCKGALGFFTVPGEVIEAIHKLPEWLSDER